MGGFSFHSCAASQVSRPGGVGFFNAAKTLQCLVIFQEVHTFLSFPLAFRSNSVLQLFIFSRGILGRERGPVASLDETLAQPQSFFLFFFFLFANPAMIGSPFSASSLSQGREGDTCRNADSQRDTAVNLQ